MKFRKKPVVIEAMQFTNGSKDKVLNFIRCSASAGFNYIGDPILNIHTLEGIMTANLGDWIIKGVLGEFYPIKPDIFEMTYEPVESEVR